MQDHVGMRPDPLFLRRNYATLAPTKNVFYISVILAALGVLGKYLGIAPLTGFAFELLLVGFILLTAGNYFKGF